MELAVCVLVRLLNAAPRLYTFVCLHRLDVDVHGVSDKTYDVGVHALYKIRFNVVPFQPFHKLAYLLLCCVVFQYDYHFNSSCQMIDML